jgi:hypothetical protein
MRRIDRRGAARLRFRLLAPVRAKEKDRVGRVRFGAGLRTPAVHPDRARERRIGAFDPAETDIRIRQRGERRNIGRVEPHRAFERPGRDPEPLRVLMQPAEQRPRFRIAAVGPNETLEV